MTRKQVFWFWGGMDAIYLARYAIASVMDGRVPYFSDVESALWLLREQSSLQFYIFLVAMFLQVSIVLSCVLFFLKRSGVKWVVYLQAPLRLALLVPSFSVLLVGAHVVPSYNVALMVMLVVVSEIAKVWSVWRWSKKIDVSAECGSQAEQQA